MGRACLPAFTPLGPKPITFERVTQDAGGSHLTVSPVILAPGQLRTMALSS